MNGSSKRSSRAIFFLAALAFLAVFLIPGEAWAQTAGESLNEKALQAPKLQIEIPTVDLAKPVREGDHITVSFLAQYITGVYRFLVSIVGVLAAVFVMIGGFQYLTAGGDASRAKAGKERIVNALAGLTLALGSYVVLYTINPNLVSFEGLELTSIVPKIYVEEGSDEELPPGSPAAPVPPGTPVPQFFQCGTESGGKVPGCAPNNEKCSWKIDDLDPAKSSTCTTICKRGCGTTSLAMVLKYYGQSVTPVETAQWGLGCTGGWQPGDTLKDLGKRWPGFRGEAIYRRNDMNKVMDRVIVELKQGPVIYNCSPCQGKRRNGSYRPSQSGHYIVLTGYDPNTKTFFVNDPGSKDGIVTYEYDNVVKNFKVAVIIKRR